MSTTDKERLVTLEVKMDNLTERLTAHVDAEEDFQDKMLVFIHEITDQLNLVLADVNRYRGVMAAVAAIFTGIGFIFVYFKNQILQHFSH